MKDKDKIIGKVSATEKNPSTIDYFYFWTDSQSDNLSPFDVVMVKNPNNDSTTYAVVEEINHVTDSASIFLLNLVLLRMKPALAGVIQIDFPLVL